MLAPEQKNQKNPADQHRQKAPELNHARNQQAVFPGVRIVVIAKEQNLIDRRTNLSLATPPPAPAASRAPDS